MVVYNTKTKRLDAIVPLNDSLITLYTCGPTVYDYLTIGNWVAFIRWDILVRTLELEGFKVKRVMNITDVGHLVSDADDGEDKLEKGARREGQTAWEVAEKYTTNFLEGMKELNLIKPTYITKATNFIDQQIALVVTLEKKGYTYKTTDGIYFDTAKFKNYPDFANLQLDQLKMGARVEFNNEKRNSSDFALWKFTPKKAARDMEWDSPWGKGFPGWHLECSAMAIDKLGETIDIHTGGIDHIPVHHTNEIAQSECATGKTFANYWIHSNFLLVDGTKISKSLGNGYTLNDVYSKGFSADDFKMFVLQSHYRTESNFTWGNLVAAQNRLQNWQKSACLIWQSIEQDPPADNCITEENLAYLNSISSIKAALVNDMDTPKTLVAIEEAFHYAEQKGLTINGLANFKALIDLAEQALGLNIAVPDITSEAKELIIERQQARNSKNWQLADELRQKLYKQGIGLKDKTNYQLWYKV